MNERADTAGDESTLAWDADVLGILMAPIEGTDIPPWALRALDAGLASIILFGYNTPDPQTARALARAIHDHAPDALVAIDEEGGDVTRLQIGTGSSLPSAWALGTVDDVALTAKAAHALGDLLSTCDVDLALAPVLDVSTDPANPVIGTRAYGDDPDRVTRHAHAFARGLRQSGIAVCGKHFPGHGATGVDSHTALPLIDLDAKQMRTQHLAPWSLAPWLDAVMTAHILVPALGEGPASLAPWSRDLLEEISSGGFHGMVVTDALDMGAVSQQFGLAEAAVRAFEAGANLLCLGTSMRRDDERMVREAHDGLVAALASGRIDRSDLTERARRTRDVVHGIRVRRSLTVLEDLPGALHALERIGATAAERSIQLRRASLSGGPVVVVDARVAAEHASGARPTRLVDALTERGVDTITAHYPGDLAPGREVLVVTRLPRTSEAEAGRLAEVLDARQDAVVVHIGVPDAAPEHRHQVHTFGGGATAMRAAVGALLDTGRA